MLVKALKKALKRKSKQMRVVIIEKDKQAFLPLKAEEISLKNGERVFAVSRYL